LALAGQRRQREWGNVAGGGMNGKRGLSPIFRFSRFFFAQTINRLKGKVTMIFITHQVPKGLQVDEVVDMGRHAMHMSLVKEDV